MKTMGLIKLVNKGNLWSFLILFARYPLNLIPTLLASYQCVKISNEHYGLQHHKNNATNAFRHALWNFLIVKKCSAWRRNKRKALRWAEIITNWHEEFSPNEPLEKEMDLHNNHIGRKLFIQDNDETIENFVKLLKEKVENSKLIVKVEDLEKYNNELVHIEKLT